MMKKIRALTGRCGVTARVMVFEETVGRNQGYCPHRVWCVRLLYSVAVTPAVSILVTVASPPPFPIH